MAGLSHLHYTRRTHHEVVVVGFLVAAAAVLLGVEPHQQAILNLAVNMVWLFEPEA